MKKNKPTFMYEIPSPIKIRLKQRKDGDKVVYCSPLELIVNNDVIVSEDAWLNDKDRLEIVSNKIKEYIEHAKANNTDCYLAFTGHGKELDQLKQVYSEYPNGIYGKLLNQMDTNKIKKYRE